LFWKETSGIICGKKYQSSIAQKLKEKYCLRWYKYLLGLIKGISGI
jgi:hypothetical protein